MSLDRTEFRLCTGTISRAALLAEDSYKIENWPVQSDMTGRVWITPEDGSDLVDYPEYVQSIAGGVGVYGTPEFFWSMQYLTPGQINYVIDDVFSGAFSVDGVTVGVPDRGTNTIRTFTAMMKREPLRNASLAAGGLHQMKISFIKTTELT